MMSMSRRGKISPLIKASSGSFRSFVLFPPLWLSPQQLCYQTPPTTGSTITTLRRASECDRARHWSLIPTSRVWVETVWRKPRHVWVMFHYHGNLRVPRQFHPSQEIWPYYIIIKGLFLTPASSSLNTPLTIITDMSLVSLTIGYW